MYAPPYSSRSWRGRRGRSHLLPIHRARRGRDLWAGPVVRISARTTPSCRGGLVFISLPPSPFVASSSAGTLRVVGPLLARAALLLALRCPLRWRPSLLVILSWPFASLCLACGSVCATARGPGLARLRLLLLLRFAVVFDSPVRAPSSCRRLTSSVRRVVPPLGRSFAATAFSATRVLTHRSSPVAPASWSRLVRLSFTSRSASGCARLFLTLRPPHDCVHRVPVSSFIMPPRIIRLAVRPVVSRSIPLLAYLLCPPDKR